MSELVCILCPTGCRLHVEMSGEQATVKGAECARGREYALAEFSTPMRTFTGTVRVEGGTRPVVSVKTDRPIPKDSILAAAGLAARTVVHAPVLPGQVLAEGLPEDARLVATSGVYV